MTQVPGRVLGLWRYPVKSTRGEALARAQCVPDGVEGDRAWGVLAADGTVVSAKSPRHGGGLLDVASRTQPDGTTLLVLPSGAELTAGTAACDDALSGLLGAPVRLSRTAVPGLRLHRLWPAQAGLVPEWQRDSRPGELETTPVAGAARGSFVDFGPVHVLTTGAVRRLERQLGDRLEPERLRPNLVLGLDADPEPGRLLQVGPDVLLRVTLPTPRCVVPALAQGELPAHARLLGALAAHHRRDVPGLGRATCFGLYADVVQPGEVALDDPVVVGE